MAGSRVAPFPDRRGGADQHNASAVRATVSAAAPSVAPPPFLDPPPHADLKSSIRGERGSLRPRVEPLASVDGARPSSHDAAHASAEEYPKRTRSAERPPAQVVHLSGELSDHPDSGEDPQDEQTRLGLQAARPPSWTDAMANLSLVKEQTRELLRRRQNLKPVGVQNNDHDKHGLIIGVARNAAPFSSSPRGTSSISAPPGSPQGADSATPPSSTRNAGLVARLKDVTSISKPVKTPVPSPSHWQHEVESIPQGESPNQRVKAELPWRNRKLADESKRQFFPSQTTPIVDLYPSVTIPYSIERSIYEVKRIIRENRYSCSRRKNSLRISKATDLNMDGSTAQALLRFKPEGDQACILSFHKASRKLDQDLFRPFYKELCSEIVGPLPAD